MAGVPVNTDKDCVLLYDEEDSKGIMEFVEKVEEYLKDKCTVGVPQRDCVPGTSAITSENAAISNTGVIILLIRRNQSSRFTELINYVIKQHSSKTKIPVYCGLNRAQAVDIPIAFSLSNLHAAYTEDENYLDMLFTGIKQEYNIVKELCSTYKKLENEPSINSSGSFHHGNISPNFFVEPLCHAKRYKKGALALNDDTNHCDFSRIIQHSKPGDTIIVHGMAGIGKTCLMNRIALNWARKEPSLQHITYVLLLHTKKIRNHAETAERIICHDLELLPEQLNVNIKLIMKFDSCLILIDGYNELSAEQREYSLLTKVLSRQVARRAVVIVTTRPEAKPYIEKRTGGNYIDLPLNRLDQQGMFSFISNFFPDSEEEFVQVSKSLMLKQYSEIPEDLTSVPLFLKMLCYLCSEEIERKEDLKLFFELRGITMGSVVATFWTLLIDKQKKEKKIINSILNILSVEYITPPTMHMIYALAKMCFNCLLTGETEFSNATLEENELNIECIRDVGPVEIDRGHMVFIHAIFQEYVAAEHIARDGTALDIVLRAYKSRQDNPALFEKYRQALVMAAGIRPAILLDIIRTVDLEITLFITEEPEYRLDLSLESDLVHACSIHDDGETKGVLKRFVSHIIKAPVSRIVKCKDLPEPNRKSFKCLSKLMNYNDCLQLVWKTHTLINDMEEDTCPFDEACTPRISPPNGGTYQAIRDPILLAALPSVDLGTTKTLGIFCIGAMVLRFVVDGVPLAVKNIRELIFLPGSIVTALQVCFLARKLTNKGHLTKITFQAKSVLLPKYLKLDESQMTIPRTTVEMLSIETHTTIDEIDYVARHMKIKKLNLVSLTKSVIDGKDIFGGCRLFSNTNGFGFSLPGIKCVTISHARGLWALSSKVYAPGVSEVKMTLADKLYVKNNRWFVNGVESCNLQNVFPSDSIIHISRWDALSEKENYMVVPFTPNFLRKNEEFWTALNKFKWKNPQTFNCMVWD